MPHTSRRKRQPARNKRQVTELEDGWQRIERTIPGPKGYDNSRFIDKVPGVDPELSIEKLKQEYERMRKRWLESTCRARVVDITKLRAPDEGLGVDTAICLAMGSVTRNWSLRIHSFWQLVFFLDVVEILESMQKDGSKISLFAQEPRFTELDGEFLKSLGVTVLADPEAQEHVGNSCFLYVPHLEWSTEIPYLEAAKDAPLYITSSMSWIIDEAENYIKTRSSRSGMSDDKASQQLLATARPEEAIKAARIIQQTHHEAKVPDCELTDVLHGTIYIKKDDTDEVIEGIKKL